ncbi:MAG TPA: 4-hydroxy-tetrahydrodipicolinate synthase [Phycisphaerales bacterium]|nr:4-hydroxy-tetrahydrodipicolinate synthase [Phycisphaerales bacterium]
MSQDRSAGRRFRGAFTAIITPFSAGGAAIDFARLGAQIEAQARGGVAGVVISGTTGESPTLTGAEYHQLLEAGVARARAAGILAVAGTGSNSTAHAVEQHRLAASLGAHGSLSVNPYYNKPTQEGLYRHFMAVADAADLPVMLYNIPGRTGVALLPATIERLARHRNIRAVKEATGSTDSCDQIIERCPDLDVLSGDDGMTLCFAALGAVGVVSVASNIVPDKVAALCAAFLGARWEEARGVHRELAGLCRALFVETNPIPVKAALRLLGRDSGELRLPMTEATPETVAALRRPLAKLGLL